MPNTCTADFSATKLYRKHQSNVPTHLLYSAPPQSYSLQAQHQPQTEKTSSHLRTVHQPSPGTIQSSGHVVSPSDPVPAAANHQSGGSETGGGSPDFGSGVAGIVGAPTGLGTGLGAVELLFGMNRA
ncbi:hypothetical protein PGT21_023110 [Puccinia graminis f. sp. tritici]|uniref:Uncharacterized protein n=1 Tax=Puccinia graminis f. sp. tritici TaxID=56615 RepID=A0A5B0RCM2_PUCGR|nr:hypothetical protein PGT21_023110 [Puccinia graminis f. sp. tritici]KAA1123516.1 hypothetical protein PGTUg99_023839 [Puccinia graminis f. sp. tritici]